MSTLGTSPEYRTIIVPLDGSTLAEGVLPIAVALAQSAHAELSLVRVHESPRMAMTNAFEWNREVAQRELDYLCTVAGRLERLSGVCAHTKLLRGHAADAIREAATHDDKTLIVMASHGRTGLSRFWLGSVADAILRESRAPILLVRSGADHGSVSSAHIRRVLVPLDGSPVAESILPPAVWLCGATGASLTLLHVVRPNEIPHVESSLQEDVNQAAICDAKSKLTSVAGKLRAFAPRMPIDVVVRVNESPADVINDYAAANSIPAVALTSRGAGLGRPIGSVADKVIRNGPPVILLLRPADADAPAFPRQVVH